MRFGASVVSGVAACGIAGAADVGWGTAGYAAHDERRSGTRS